jgi:hypothetical protein
MRHSRIGWIALALGVAMTAAAFTCSDVSQHATTLEQQFLELKAEVGACHGGACADGASLRDQLDQRDADLARVRFERSQVAPCEDPKLDATLGRIQDLSDSTHVMIEEWEIAQ